MQISYVTPKGFARLGPIGKEVEAIDLLVRGHVKQAEKLMAEVVADEPWRKPCQRDLKFQIRQWFRYDEPRLNYGLAAPNKALSAKSLAFATSQTPAPAPAPAPFPVLVPSAANDAADLHPEATLRRRIHQGRKYVELPSSASNS